jgi:hypothetical protein
LECDADGDFTIAGNALISSWLSSVTGSDACGVVDLVNNYNENNFSNGCGATGTQVVTFMATDECGNTATCTSTVTILDTTAPDIVCPANLTLECDEDSDFTIAGNVLISAWLSSVSGSDACGVVDLVNNYNENNYSNGCGATGTQVVTFTATDECDNTTTCTSTVTILDTTAPDIVCPANLTLECDADGDFTIAGNALISSWLCSVTGSDA